VFVPGSPREVTINEAVPLAGTSRSNGMLPVGVFRNAPVKSVSEAAVAANLDAVQLHGAEDPDYVTALRRALPGGCEIWTAVSVGRDPTADRGADRLLFDNGEGGSGRNFDWALIERHPELPRALVAGGIGPHNARAARALGAYAIDVGSAVDERPGRKSPEKIAALFEVLRPQSRERALECA
jgi:indole-3-glycerol phosphate synthase/phosphoribosylanthranilate isomerase